MYWYVLVWGGSGLFRVMAEWHIIVSVTRYDIYEQQIIRIILGTICMLVLLYTMHEHLRIYDMNNICHVLC